MRDTQEIFQLLENWIKQKPGLDPANYGFDRAEGRAAYQSESRRISRDGRAALASLAEARQLQPGRVELLEGAFSAFSGRLSLTADGLSYCTGQYWPTEYRPAAEAVYPGIRDAAES